MTEPARIPVPGASVTAKPTPVATPSAADPASPTNDFLTLVIRVHDPKEKRDASVSACWATVKIDRAAISLSAEVFAQKYVVPALKTLKNLRLT
jgi:hypothetical protein